MLVLLVGVVGAVVLATLAGARRSATALPRFNAFSRSSDITLISGGLGLATPAQLRAVRRVPGVVGVGELRGMLMNIPHAPNLTPVALVDAKHLSVVDRARVVAGRAANPSVADEITIGEALSTQLHVGVGDGLDAESYTPAQAAVAVSGNNDPGPPAGPRVHLRIVGIDRRPLDLGDKSANGGALILTPAFNRAYADQIGSFGTLLRIRTEHGSADVPHLVAAAHRIFAGSSFFDAESVAVEGEGARNAIDVLTVALWVFAGVAALAGVVTIGIVLARELSSRSVEQPTLRALGLTLGQRVALSGPEALCIAFGGTALAAVGAVAASPLFPIGVARRADPDVGLHTDWVVLGFGVLAVTAVVLVIALLAAFRSAQVPSVDHANQARGRPSRIVDTAARVGLAPTVTTGLRMALEPGRGERAVPIRSAFLGAVIGILGITTVFVFSSSVGHLRTTPRLSGWTWDFTASGAADNSCGRQDHGLHRLPGVGAVATVCLQNIQLDGRPVGGWSFTKIRGTIAPAVVLGRAPRGPHEVALGSVTLHALGKTIGDTVVANSTAQGSGGIAKVRYRIVGQAVFAPLGDTQPLADGAAFTRAGFDPLLDPSGTQPYWLGRYAPEADRAAVNRRIAAIPGFEHLTGTSVAVEIARLGEIDWFPATLAALLGGLALLAVGHALVTTARRRRRELGLLKTLGFDRGQVRATIAWQATTLAVVGLVVGIPAGLIVGWALWNHIAESVGVSTTATVPIFALLLTVSGALALVNLIAYFPARTAARTRAAVALRSE